MAPGGADVGSFETFDRTVWSVSDQMECTTLLQHMSSRWVNCVAVYPILELPLRHRADWTGLISYTGRVLLAHDRPQPGRGALPVVQRAGPRAVGSDLHPECECAGLLTYDRLSNVNASSSATPTAACSAPPPSGVPTYHTCPTKPRRMPGASDVPGVAGS